VEPLPHDCVLSEIFHQLTRGGTIALTGVPPNSTIDEPFDGSSFRPITVRVL